MSEERTRPRNASGDGVHEVAPVDVPFARSSAPSAVEPTFSEAQVAQILQRIVELERGKTSARPALTLAEVESIARESGLDPSLVRIAAQSIEQQTDTRGWLARMFGPPPRRIVERVVDGEISAAQHEHLGALLRALVPAGAMLRPPQISGLGRALTLTVQDIQGRLALQIELVPRNGKTSIRVESPVPLVSGAVVGGFFAMLPAMVSLPFARQSGLGPAVAIAGVVGSFGTCGVAGHRLGIWLGRREVRRLESLADAISARVRDEFALGAADPSLR